MVDPVIKRLQNVEGVGPLDGAAAPPGAKTKPVTKVNWHMKSLNFCWARLCEPCEDDRGLARVCGSGTRILR